jgi:hypothetical protein
MGIDDNSKQLVNNCRWWTDQDGNARVHDCMDATCRTSRTCLQCRFFDPTLVPLTGSGRSGPVTPPRLEQVTGSGRTESWRTQGNPSDTNAAETQQQETPEEKPESLPAGSQEWYQKWVEEDIQKDAKK